MNRKILITGGAGFIGTNASLRFVRDGWDVTILDNLSRRGTDRNLEWLQRSVNSAVTFHQADIRDAAHVEDIVRSERFDAMLHLAAQVAVTTSVVDPRTDFEINAHGTLNLLEAVRKHNPDMAVLFTSTNKVYGKMETVVVEETGGRYAYRDLVAGTGENQQLDFHSPYGCSKGIADQYMIDYGRVYGLRTAVLRQSCIYGPRQFGVEDQGWVAWFAIAALLDKQITIYGDGKQVRDVLHVSDAVDLYVRLIDRIDDVKAQAFNVGGGPRNTLSLLELIDILEKRLGKTIPLQFDAWRAGDQKVFVCDIRKLKTFIGWEPQIGVGDGVSQLIDWVRQNADTIRDVESLG